MDSKWSIICCNGFVFVLLFVIWRIMYWNRRFERFERSRPKKQSQQFKVVNTIRKDEPPVDIKPSARLGNSATKLNIFVSNLPANPYEANVIKNTFKLERDPHNATLYCDRGAAHLMLQNYDGALSDFNRAIELKPNYADAYSNRGLVHYAQEKYQEALSDYNQAIEISNTDAVYFLNRGQVYRQLGSYEQALADLNRSTALVPNLPDTTKERGLVYYAMGNREQALTELELYETMSNYFMTDAEAIRALMNLRKSS
jgi:tetratricopeptide (TPR) repeat protein